MIVVVTGSRAFHDMDEARQVVAHRLAQLYSTDQVLQGGADGVDTWAREIAEGLGMDVRTMHADWMDHTGCTCRNRLIPGAHCRWAGYRRNRQMLDEKPGLVLGFWNGWSPGTKDCMDEADRRGIEVEVIIIGRAGGDL